jgi:hypothetical protein
LDFFVPHATEVCERMLPDCGLESGAATVTYRNNEARRVRDFFI